MDWRSIRAVAIVVLGVTLAGCGAADKAGSETLVLHLAANDGTMAQDQLPGPKAFLDSLASLSGGRIQVDFSLNFAGGGVDSETKLVQATAAGEVDGGWPSVRGFASAGIRGLQAVEAPMMLTSYAAVKELVSGPVAADLLGQLRGTGVVGLGLAVGPLRRPFAAKGPLLGPTDWQGIAFRSFDSPVQDATVRALGATPLHAGSEWIDDIASGQLRGAEFDITQYSVNGYTSEAPYVTANVVLWPKVFVFTLSQKRWDALSDQQRTWVKAAAAAGTKASVDATYDETTVARTLCDAGVSFVDASPSQLAALHAAVAPVIAGLAADPVTSPLLAKIQSIAARHPETDVPNVPANCRTARGPAPTAPIPSTASSLPNGVYRQRVTLADAEAAGVPLENGPQGTWTLTVKDGTFSLSCRFISDPAHDCGNSHFDGATVEVGRLLGEDHTVYFVGDVGMLQKAIGCALPESTQDGHCYVIPPYWFTWAIQGDQLTFSNPGGDPADSQMYSLRPWTRIG